MSSITSSAHTSVPPDETFERLIDFDSYAEFMASVDTVRTDDGGCRVYFGYSVARSPGNSSSMSSSTATGAC